MKVNGEHTTASAVIRRTQAQRTATTRARLIAAGRDIFGVRDFHDVSTQELVSAAGVTRGALYHQFTDKAALFEAVYEQVEEELVADVLAGVSAARPADAVAAMRVGVRLFLARCADPAVRRIALISAPAVLGWDTWRAVGAKYGLGAIEAMLAAAVAAGEIPDQPVRAAAHLLLGALDEAALFIARAPDGDAARADMYALCDRLLDGIAGRAAAG